jgi:hypothetical protein
MNLVQIVSEPYYLLYLMVNSRDFIIEDNRVKCLYDQYVEKSNIEERINQLEMELSQADDETIKFDLRESISIFNTILQKIN